MKDRFKFRGKRIDNNQWYYGSYLYLHNPPKYEWNGTKHEGKEDVHFIIDEKDVNYGVYPETVGQCTGLKDKNGKLIYEGDIVSVKVEIQDFFGDDEYYSEKYKGKIIYDKGEIVIDVVDTTKHTISLYRHAKNCEIVGNIYENQELLKEVNNDNK